MSKMGHRIDYSNHKSAAKGRDIKFELTYKEWISIWKRSGHLHERGRHKDQYVMARYGDKGPYAIDNVKIITVAQNCSENGQSHKGKPKSEDHKEKLSKARKGKRFKPHSKETRQKISRAMTGKKRPSFSMEWRRKISEAGRRRYAIIAEGQGEARGGVSKSRVPIRGKRGQGTPRPLKPPR